MKELDHIGSKRLEDILMKPLSPEEMAKKTWTKIRQKKKELRKKGETSLILLYSKSRSEKKLKNAERAIYELLVSKKQNPFFEKVKQGEPCFISHKCSMYRLMIPIKTNSL